MRLGMPAEVEINSLSREGDQVAEGSDVHTTGPGLSPTSPPEKMMR